MKDLENFKTDLIFWFPIERLKHFTTSQVPCCTKVVKFKNIPTRISPHIRENANILNNTFFKSWDFPVYPPLTR